MKEIHNKFIQFQCGVVNIAVRGNPMAQELQALEEQQVELMQNRINELEKKLQNREG